MQLALAAALPLLLSAAGCMATPPVADDTPTKATTSNAQARGVAGAAAPAAKEKFVCKSERHAELLRAKNTTDKLKLLVLGGKELFFVEQGAKFDTLHKLDLDTRADAVLEQPQFRYGSLKLSSGLLYFDLISDDFTGGGLHSLPVSGGKPTQIAEYRIGQAVPIFAVTDKYLYVVNEDNGAERVEIATGKWTPLSYGVEMARPRQHPDGLWFQVQSSDGTLPRGTYRVDPNDPSAVPMRMAKGEGEVSWALTSNGVFYYAASNSYIRHYDLDPNVDTVKMSVYSLSRDDEKAYVAELAQRQDGKVVYFYPSGANNTVPHPIRSMNVDSFEVGVIACDHHEVINLTFDANYLYFIENGGDSPGIYRLAK